MVPVFFAQAIDGSRGIGELRSFAQYGVPSPLSTIGPVGPEAIHR